MVRIGYIKAILREFFVRETNPLVELLADLKRAGSSAFSINDFGVDEQGIFAEIHDEPFGSIVYFHQFKSDSPSREMEALVNNARNRGFSVYFSPDAVAAKYRKAGDPLCSPHAIINVRLQATRQTSKPKEGYAACQ